MHTARHPHSHLAGDGCAHRDVGLAREPVQQGMEGRKEYHKECGLFLPSQLPQGICQFVWELQFRPGSVGREDGRSWPVINV